MFRSLPLCTEPQAQSAASSPTSPILDISSIHSTGSRDSIKFVFRLCIFGDIPPPVFELSKFYSALDFLSLPWMDSQGAKQDITGPNSNAGTGSTPPPAEFRSQLPVMTPPPYFPGFPGASNQMPFMFPHSFMPHIHGMGFPPPVHGSPPPPLISQMARRDAALRIV